MHYLTLVLGGAFVFSLQQGQWFFFDDWAFIEPGGADLFTPHVGHWSTSPTVVFDALLAAFGLRSYLPWMALVTLLHLAAAHLVWRIARRTGSSGWIATGGVAVFIVLGSGSENILWGFQIGFIGALVLGLGAFLIAMAPRIGPARLVLVIAILVFSLTWSGTAIPLVVATAALVAFRGRWWQGLLVAVVTGSVYLTWYLLSGAGDRVGTGDASAGALVIGMVAFIGVMLILGFGDVFGIPGVGFAALVAVAVWSVVLLARGRRIPGSLPAFLLAGAAAVFALMSAYSRAEMSIGAGRSSRYVYLLVLLLLPLLGLALSRAIERWRPAAIIAAVALPLLIAYQAALLVIAAQAQSATEQGSRRLLSAAVELYLEDPSGVRLDASPDPRWAPDLQLGELVELYRDGWFTPVEVSAEDLDEARDLVLTDD